MTERRPWTSQQDKVLKSLRQDQKIKKWSQIARIMQNSYQIIGRNQKQCRERYQNHLSSTIVSDKLTEDQEILLFNLHDNCGNKWSIIANHFPGRTDNSLKNHFHSKLRGAIRKINRYLGCRKKRGAKNFPLSIVYRIVKFFGQNIHKDLLSESDCSMIGVLKNSLLKFVGGNLGWKDEQDDGNEKKTAERIVGLLERFEELVKMVGSRSKIALRPQEPIQFTKERQIKTQEALPQNSDRTEYELFRTFSSSSISESRSLLKDSQYRIEIPIAVKSYSKQLSREDSQPQLQFQKLDFGHEKLEESVSEMDSDVMKLVQEKSIIQDRKLLKKGQSFSEYSMEILEDCSNQLRRGDSTCSKGSNIWRKELDYQMKLDSCIFE